MVFQFSNARLIACSVLCAVLISPPLAAADPSADAYDESIASRSEILTGSIVEGSSSRGGLQPNYRIDFDSREFAPLRSKMKKIRGSTEPDIIKIARAVQFVRDSVFTDREYDSSPYLRLLSKYRKSGKDIPLSEYAKAKAGVCREDALILHLALREAGFESKYYYIKVKFRWENAAADTIEDHAFNVIEYMGEKWVVDSNTPRYNGYKLSDTMKGIRIGDDSKLERLPFAIPNQPVDRRVTAVLDYPKLWTPKECVTSFADMKK